MILLFIDFVTNESNYSIICMKVICPLIPRKNGMLQTQQTLSLTAGQGGGWSMASSQAVRCWQWSDLGWHEARHDT